MARFPGALGLRAARAAEVAEGRLAMLGVWRNPARLLIVRNGNPLCFGETGRRVLLRQPAGRTAGQGGVDHGPVRRRPGLPRRRTSARRLFDREVSDAILDDHGGGAVLHVDPSRVRLLCKRGRIKTIKVGNTYAIPERELERFAAIPPRRAGRGSDADASQVDRADRLVVRPAIVSSHRLPSLCDRGVLFGLIATRRNVTGLPNSRAMAISAWTPTLSCQPSSISTTTSSHTSR